MTSASETMMGTVEERKAIERMSQSWRRLVSGARAAVQPKPVEGPEGGPETERQERQGAPESPEKRQP